MEMWQVLEASKRQQLSLVTRSAETIEFCQKPDHSSWLVTDGEHVFCRVQSMCLVTAGIHQYNVTWATLTLHKSLALFHSQSFVVTNLKNRTSRSHLRTHADTTQISCVGSLTLS